MARIMDVALLQQQLHEALKLNEQLRQQNQQQAQAFNQLRHDHEALLETTRAVVEDREQLQQRVAELEAANTRLVDMLWGRRSERRSVSPDQLSLDFAALPEDENQQLVITAQQQADDEFDEQLLRELEARRRRRRANQRRQQNQSFPEHIERRETVLDLSDDEKAGLKYIGDAVTERLRFEKPTLYVERIVRRKYVVENAPDQGVTSPSAPLGIVEGCRYDFSVIAAILEQKFAFHNPTYRQQNWFAQTGWSPSRSTINDLINHSVETLRPLYDQMNALVMQQAILHTDDTRLLLLTRNALNEQQLGALEQRRRQGRPPDEAGQQNDPGSVTSYAWVYAGLDCGVPYNVFHWSLTHQHAVVDAHLADFHGTIVGDGYSGYTQIEQRSGGRIVHASCNAHARREFTKAELVEPVLSAQAESFYAQLYDIEERAFTLAADARHELRQREAVPIWRQFGQWLHRPAVQRCLPRSAFGKAVTYLTNQWEGLQRYLTDGRIAIDNNLAEQAIRPLTCGRKNWLFLGHPAAAEGRLQLLSVVSSAQRQNLIVYDYLQDVLRRLADAIQNHPADLELGSEYLLELLPDRWAKAHPKSIHHRRVDEKQAVSDAKRARRARRRLAARRRARTAR